MAEKKVPERRNAGALKLDVIMLLIFFLVAGTITKLGNESNT